MVDGNFFKRKRSRDISEIYLEVLEVEKDKLRLGGFLLVICWIGIFVLVYVVLYEVFFDFGSWG